MFFLNISFLFYEIMELCEIAGFSDFGWWKIQTQKVYILAGTQSNF